MKQEKKVLKGLGFVMAFLLFIAPQVLFAAELTTAQKERLDEGVMLILGDASLSEEAKAAAIESLGEDFFLAVMEDGELNDADKKALIESANAAINEKVAEVSPALAESVQALVATLASTFTGGAEDAEGFSTEPDATEPGDTPPGGRKVFLRQAPDRTPDRIWESAPVESGGTHN